MGVGSSSGGNLATITIVFTDEGVDPALPGPPSFLDELLAATGTPDTPGPSTRVFTFCHKGGVICISEVIDISPSNLDSSLCFIQPCISHDILCI